MLNKKIFLSIVFLFSAACGGGGSAGAEDEATLAAPELADVLTSLVSANASGVVVGKSFSAVTLPVCLDEDGNAIDFDVSYAVSDLPDWLSFDAATRTISLADGEDEVDAEASAALEVTYTCTSDADDANTASLSFTLNDTDGGGIIDQDEYRFSETPLLNNNSGWFWLNADNLDLYRPQGDEGFLLPTNVTSVNSGLNVADAADDAADFDSDGVTNAAEITAGTNLFVAASAGNFVAGDSFATATNSRGLAIADLNSDNFPDLILANAADADVGVLFGEDGGSFADMVTYDVDLGPDGIVVGDLDADGDFDIVSVNNDGNSVSVLLNEGDGTFAAAVDHDVGANPVWGALADFDGDGDLDLVTADSGDNQISLLLGNGAGSFAGAEEYAAADINTFSGLVADLDADEQLDVLVPNGGAFLNDDLNSLSFFSNDNLAFTLTELNDSLDDPFFVKAGDFNADDALDVLVGAQLFGVTEESARVMLATGALTFSNTDYDLGEGVSPENAAVADVDGDGDLDAVLCDVGTSDVILLTNDGSGAMTVSTIDDVNDGCSAIAMADVDGDGDLDIVVSRTVPEQAQLYLNQ